MLRNGMVDGSDKDERYVSLASSGPNENNGTICDLEDWKAFRVEKV